MEKLPLEKNKCVVVLETGGQFIPVVGVNQTTKGYFNNYYINKAHPFFGKYPHDSRHETLIASRYNQEYDLFSSSEKVSSIDQRKNPEILPCRSITRDLFCKPISETKLQKIVKRPLIVPLEKCRNGVIVVVKVWPKSSNDMNKLLLEPWEISSLKGPLVESFTPECFTNKVLVSVFSEKNLFLRVQIPQDGTVKTTSPTWVPVGSPFNIRGKRKEQSGKAKK